MKKSIILFVSFVAILMCGCEKKDGGCYVYPDPLMVFVDKNGVNLFASQTCEEWVPQDLECEYKFINHQGANVRLTLENMRGQKYVYYWTFSNSQKEGFTRTAKLTSEYIFGDSEPHFITVSWGKANDGCLHCTEFTLDEKKCDITTLKDMFVRGYDAYIVTIVVDREI